MWRCTKIDKYGVCLRVVEKPPLNRAKVSTVQYKEKLTAWTTNMLLKVLNRGQWFHIAVWEIKLLVNLWWRVDKDSVIVFAFVVVTVVVVVDVFVFVFALANVGQLMKSWWSGSLLQLLPLVWTRGLISQRYQLSLNAQRRKSKMHSLGLLNVPAVRMYKVSSILQSPLRGFANFSNLNNLRASASALRQNYSLAATKNSNEEENRKKEHWGGN